MSGKLRKFWVNVCALVLVVTLVINPNMISSVRAEDTFTPIKTVFYVLNRGYERPLGTTSQKQAKYTKVGDGYIKYAINISEDDKAVADNIYIEPDSSDILEDDEQIVWYVCKKETDGWHIDGEIVSKETDNTTTETTIETTTENATIKEPETSTIEEETEPSNGELETETTDINKNLTTAHFAVLKDGYTRPSEAKSDKQYKYIKVGDGKIYKEITISNDDKAVLENIAKVPDLTDYIPEGKTVVWYVCKKEADGWHIDGEIVEKEAETSVTEVSTTEAVTKETDTSTTETSTTKDTEQVTTEEVTKVPEQVTTEEVTKATEQVTTEEVTKATEQVTTEEVTKATEPATTKALTTAHFAVLKDGYTRPSEAKSDKQYKYIKVGDGKIYDAVKIENNDVAVLANIAEVPDLTDYIPEGKKVVWYVCKKEADGWHIDGEIVTDEKTTEEITTKETEEKTTEEVTTKEPEEKTTEEVTTKEPEEKTTEEVTTKEPEEKTTEEVTTKEPEQETTEEETTEVQKSNEELLREEMYQMLITGDTSEHDISKYHFTYIQMDKIWEKMVAEEGYIAKHATGMAYLNVTRNSDNTIKTIYFENMDSDFVNRYNRMLTAINEIKAATSDPTMTDLDRIMYVHDYLVERVTYKETGFISHTAGGALGDGLAVCQGYADALQVVFHEIGIDTYYISSNAMNHAWIYVRLDGELYNIDATWDDGTEYNGGISRMYMLRSDSEYYGGLKHYSWTVHGTDEKATSGKYYKWFVHDIEGKMRYYNGYWYYVDTTVNSIIKAKSDGSEMITVLDGSKLNTLTIDDITDGRLKYFVGNVEMTMPLD